MNEQWQMNKLISWKFYSKIHTLILKSNSRNTLVSSRLSRKRKLSILLNFPFPFVFFGVFSILKYKNLVLKTTTWWTSASHFVDGWHFLRCQICLFPHPLCGWPWGFCGEGGYGWEFFFLKSLELEIFPLTHNSVRFIFQHYIRHERFFVSVQDIFFPVISLQAFSPRNQSAGYFFWNHP